MTTTETTVITALQHIAAGHDAVCTDCGWMGRHMDAVGRSVCPICGQSPVMYGHRHIAAYALRQIEGGGE